MTSFSFRLAVFACALGMCTVASANRDVERLIADPSNWAMQAGDMYNQRYSKLNQINAGNVGDLQVAWTFSTGVLRGHEGSPLVIGDTMFIHTPFPNKVFVTMRDGKVFEKEILDPKGHPNNPLSREELEEKFRSACAGLLTKSKQDRVIDAVWNLECVSDLGDMMKTFKVA